MEVGVAWLIMMKLLKVFGVEVKFIVATEGGRLWSSAPVAASAQGMTCTDQNAATASTDRVTFQYHKIREFKITGGRWRAEENVVDLAYIQFQMKEASDLGYTTQEI